MTTRERDRTSGSRRNAPAGGRTNRRGFMKALGAGAAAVTLGTTASGAASAQEFDADSFVDVDGTDFVIDGEPVYFNGSNNFWITDDSDGSEARIDAVFSHFEEMGIDVVRMWAHGEGKEGDLTLQPEPGVHNEEALELHDYAVQSAKEHGIRLIVALVDNWVHEGGMAQYAAWVEGEDLDPDNYEYTEGLHEVFYTDEEARDLYRNHVETILTRENVYTGLEWREDPTIMMWELANEPRFQADWYTDVTEADEEELVEIRENEEHKEILGNWIQDMSEYVKELDDNHLVSTGSEGHYYGTWDDEYPDDNWDGQDYIEHHSYDTIDAASFHWYPDHWNVDLSEGSQWIEDHVQDAHEELGKPAYLGEFNVQVQRPGMGDPNTPPQPLPEDELEHRNSYLEEWYEAADAVDCNAVLIWQVVLDDTGDHDGFQVYRDESGYVIEEYADIVAEKSGGDGGGECADGIEVGGYCAQDTTGDGFHEDVNGDGTPSQQDVAAYFEHLDSDAVQNNPDAFNFDGEEGIGFSDIVALFQRL